MSSKVVDPEVLEAIAAEGYRLDSSDPLGRIYIDAHGRGLCELTELGLLGETPESVKALIRELHSR